MYCTVLCDDLWLFEEADYEGLQVIHKHHDDRDYYTGHQEVPDSEHEWQGEDVKGNVL